MIPLHRRASRFAHTAAANGRVVLDRVRRRGAQTRIGHIGAGYNGNVGDEAVSFAAERLLGPSAMLDFYGDVRERRLQSVGLSGPDFFDCVVLGGGTLINDMALAAARHAVRSEIPLWSLGTGAGNPGYFSIASGSLAGWREVLPKMHRIGVRGPRSRAILAAVGGEHAEVVGDLALALTPEALPARPPENGAPTFGVNLTFPRGTGGGTWTAETLAGLEDAIRALRRRGLEPEFFAMHSDDLPALDALKSRLGLARQATVRFAHPAHCQKHLTRYRFVLASRLHSAVLACTVGVPSISLGYGPKCLDFMESMGLEEWHVDLSSASRDRFTELSCALETRAEAERAVIFARSHEYKTRLETFARATMKLIGGSAP